MMTEPEIEQALRQAPQPAAPAGLKQRLLNQVSLKSPARASQAVTVRPIQGGWLRRWWPVLVPAAGCAACAVVITAQQLQIHDLQHSIQVLTTTGSKSNPDQIIPATPLPKPGAAPAAGANQDQEIEHLKATVRQLGDEIRPLEQMRLENDRLRAQLAAPPTGRLTVEETEALDQARERAQSIQCVNNLKQLGLACKIWAIDHQDTFPSEVLLMTNEISTPKVLACPGDAAHPAVSDWKSFTASSGSYEFLGATGSDAEPTRVIFRCPIHGSVTLADGSVQMGIAKKHPERLVNRDGKLFLLER